MFNLRCTHDPCLLVRHDLCYVVNSRKHVTTIRYAKITRNLLRLSVLCAVSRYLVVRLGEWEMTDHEVRGLELDYCRQREAEEREAGAGSGCARARDVHLQLADRYADRAWSLEEANDAPYPESGLWAAIRAMVALPYVKGS